MNSRSKPRYKDSNGRKRQPREASPTFRRRHPILPWLGSLMSLIIVPYALWWGFQMVVNPYRVFFEDRPTNVTLDGRPLALDAANGFGLSRFAIGTHHLSYTDAAGKPREVSFRAKLDDGDGQMAISERRVSGVPKGEFARR